MIQKWSAMVSILVDFDIVFSIVFGYRKLFSLPESVILVGFDFLIGIKIYLSPLFHHFLISTRSITCEAMVFRVTQNGTLKADTLCEFTKKPNSVTRLVGDKHKVCLKNSLS